LTNPSAGTNSIQVTISRAGGDYVMAGAMSFFGVDQTNPIDATASNSASSPNPSGTITPVNNNTLAIDNLYSGGNLGLSSSGWTNQYMTNDSVYGQSFGGAYKGPISPPSSQTDTWTSAYGQLWADAMATLKPAP